MNMCKTCGYFIQDAMEDHCCSCPKFVYGYHGSPPVDGMLVESDEGWGFVPGPEFGCVHWKKVGG